MILGCGRFMAGFPTGISIVMNVPMTPKKIVAEVIELDDGKILTGKPIKFDGKNPWVSCKFSLKPLYLMVKPMGFRLKFSQQNQSSDEEVQLPLFSGQPLEFAASHDAAGVDALGRSRVKSWKNHRFFGSHFLILGCSMNSYDIHEYHVTSPWISVDFLYFSEFWRISEFVGGQFMNRISHLNFFLDAHIFSYLFNTYTIQWLGGTRAIHIP